MQLLSLEQWISTVFVKALGVTFLHSIWQALLALVVCHLLLAATKKSLPAVRYNLLVVVAIAFVLTSLTTFAMQFRQADNVSEPAAIHPALQYIVGGGTPDTAPVIAQWQTLTSAASSFFHRYTDIFITIWFIIFSFKCLQLSLSIGYIKRITSYGSEGVGNEWNTIFQSLRRKLDVTTEIRLLKSDIIKVPMTAGFFKPVIILPMSMLTNLSPEMVESILLHELAHIKRRDYLVNLIQSVVETIFFFNPFVLKISSLIKDEREACCDSVAVEVIKNKVTYVNALVAFGEYSTSQHMSALAFAGHKNYLLNRVKRILFNQNKKPGVMEKSILACCLIMLLGLAVFSTANGTEKKLKSSLMNTLQSFVTDTVPSSVDAPGRVKNRRTERQARRRAEKERAELQSTRPEKMSEEEREELEQSLREVEIEREELKRELEELKELRKEQVEELKKHEIEIQNDIDIEQLKEMAHENAQQQLVNRELQKTLADVQIQLKNTIALNTQKQQLMLKNFMNDSTITRLKNIRINIEHGEVRDILQFLEQHNVAKSKDITSFSLDENDLVVNNKVQPADLHEQLKRRYLGKKGDHINYLRSGNSTSISIQRNDPSEKNSD